MLKLLLRITVSGVLLIVLVATFIPALPLLIVEAGSGPPLGEIGGLHYVWWDFGTDNFESLRIYVTIYNEPDNDDGLYFQMYQGRINDVGFYFGLQTRLSNPNTGVTAKGLIFSRWETRDLSNVRPAEGGWSQSAGYEGDFVGIRKHYEWTNHSYQLKIAYVESDEVGDYAVTLIVTDNDGALSAYSRAIMVGGAVRKGDFDGDGDIDFFDFVAFAACYGSILGSANYNVIGDFDEDGYVDLYDFVDFAAVYGT